MNWTSNARDPRAAGGFGSGFRSNDLPKADPMLVLFGHGESQHTLGSIADAAPFSFTVQNLATRDTVNVERAVDAIRDKAGFFLLGLSEASVGEDSPAQSAEHQAVGLLLNAPDFFLGLVAVDAKHLMVARHLQSERRRIMVRLVVLRCEPAHATATALTARFPNLAEENIFCLGETGHNSDAVLPLVVAQMKKLLSEELNA